MLSRIRYRKLFTITKRYPRWSQTLNHKYLIRRIQQYAISIPQRWWRIRIFDWSECLSSCFDSRPTVLLIWALENFRPSPKSLLVSSVEISLERKPPSIGSDKASTSPEWQAIIDTMIRKIHNLSLEKQLIILKCTRYKLGIEQWRIIRGWCLISLSKWRDSREPYPDPNSSEVKVGRSVVQCDISQYSHGPWASWVILAAGSKLPPYLLTWIQHRLM